MATMLIYPSFPSSNPQPHLRHCEVLRDLEERHRAIGISDGYEPPAAALQQHIK